MCLVLCFCYVYLCLCADMHAMVCTWSQRTACGGRTSPSIVWVMGVELTLPGLSIILPFDLRLAQRSNTV